MDWSTLFASAGVSAVVGAVVSLMAASQLTVRSARAERREAARLAVAAAVEPLRVALARYQYLSPREAKRTNEQSHLDDHAKAVRVLRAAGELPWWRRRLVERRCRMVFGDYWTNLALDFPSASEDNSLGSWLAASVRDSIVKEGAGPLDGLLHRTYCQQADGPLGPVLRKQLRRLAACW